MLLHNDTDAGNWLLLRLTDRHGSATPTGSRRVPNVNDKRLLRVVLGGGSFGGEGDHRVHFGPGEANSVESIEIHGLSGKTRTPRNVPTNQILNVRET